MIDACTHFISSVPAVPQVHILCVFSGLISIVCQETDNIDYSTTIKYNMLNVCDILSHARTYLRHDWSYHGQATN